MAVKNKLTE